MIVWEACQLWDFTLNLSRIPEQIDSIFSSFRIAGWWVEQARGWPTKICISGYLKFSHISAHFCITIQTSEARLKTKKKNVEEVWAKFDAIVMIRRGGGLARGFIQLAVEEKEIAGAEAEGIVGC